MIAAFMIVTITGIMTDLRQHRSQDAASAMARLKEQLPAHPALVSFGHVDALFRYYHGEFVTPLPWPEHGETEVAPGTYFCYNSSAGASPLAPRFPWREIATIPLDRDRIDPPQRYVVVGVRLPTAWTEPPPVGTLAAAR